jgi:hypothetical protein
MTSSRQIYAYQRARSKRCGPAFARSVSAFFVAGKNLFCETKPFDPAAERGSVGPGRHRLVPAETIFRCIGAWPIYLDTRLRVRHRDACTAKEQDCSAAA